ncbi:hypothetical protein TR13x_06740 [Caloranaerobacter sp. TR13]|uniref:hypothetical protein n=1 Tax=Caloranaerobacter sp. TR13 TaxID=1302151 RepID=UPI0006D421F7|nr:hypothetical protein [Caloranaerobacter sp. TR13]KPU27088.1 hypothetical protein TR13x_06740 [Caloranaerobacter sp. TR13]
MKIKELINKSLPILLCISILLNIFLLSTLFDKQKKIDRFLKISNFSAAGTVNIILSELEDKLVKVDEEKLKDRRYVIQTLNDIERKLNLCDLPLGFAGELNSNFDFDVIKLEGYIYRLERSFVLSKEGFSDYDRQVLKKIASTRLYTTLTDFYEENSFYQKKPRYFIRDSYKKLEKICDEAIKKLDEQK